MYMVLALFTCLPLTYLMGGAFVFFVCLSCVEKAMVDVMGVWEAFLVCVGVCGAWLWLFDWHFKARMPHNQQRREEEKNKKSPVRRRK